ncbi:MAG: RrF2 family transcriptional regulator [Spirochaetia bacterium]
MRITTKGRYAVRAMINLCINENGSPISIKSIAQQEEISPEFLEQIFFKLKKSGIISSTRGPGGGFRLNKKMEEITIYELFDAVEEGLQFTPCTNCSTSEVCNKVSTCVSHILWRKISTSLIKDLENTSLADLMEEGKSARLIS